MGQWFFFKCQSRFAKALNCNSFRTLNGMEWMKTSIFLIHSITSANTPVTWQPLSNQSHHANRLHSRLIDHHPNTRRWHWYQRQIPTVQTPLRNLRTNEFEIECLPGSIARKPSTRNASSMREGSDHRLHPRVSAILFGQTPGRDELWTWEFLHGLHEISKETQAFDVV